MRPATPELVASLDAAWPMGVVAAAGQGLHGIIFQVGEREMLAAKAQPPDVPAALASKEMFFNRMRLIAAVPRYRFRGHQGITLPCAYLREKPGGQAEAGIAVFASPARGGTTDPELAATGLDDALGAGAATMVFDFLRDLTEAGRELGLPSYPLIGLDVRARLALGQILFDTMLFGAEVISIKRHIDEQDPLWEMMAAGGITEVWSMPSVPAAREGPNG